MVKEEVVKNLLECWNRADSERMRAGLNWYSRANDRAREIAAKCGVTTEVVCGVIAALSPGREWNKNVEDAAGFIRAFVWSEELPLVGSYGQRNRDKALRILEGHKPLDVLGGPKVRAFFNCLVRPENETDVCVDRHAKSAAFGKVLEDREEKMTRRQFEFIADCYRWCAGKIGVLPNQFQAVVWEVWKN